MAVHRSIRGDSIVERQVAPIGHAAAGWARNAGAARPGPPWVRVWASPCWHRGGLETVTITHLRKATPGMWRELLLVGDARAMDDSIPRGMEVVVDPRCFEGIGRGSFEQVRERFRERCEDLKPDVVVGQLAHAPLYGANDAGVPVIVEYWHCGQGWDAMDHPSDCIVAVSHATAFQCVRRGRRPRVPVRVILNGIDAGLFRPEAEKTKAVRKLLGLEAGLVLGFSGRFCKEKRPIAWIEALAELRRRGLDLRGLMVGMPWDRRAYEETRQRASQLGFMWHRDVVQRSVAYEEMPAYYRAMDLLLHMRADEPFGMVIPEALLCGTPVVAIAGGGVPEIAERVPEPDDLLLAEPGDDSDVIALAEGALTRGRGVRSSRAGLERAFGAEAMATRFEALLRRHLESAGRREAGDATRMLGSGDAARGDAGEPDAVGWRRGVH